MCMGGRWRGISGTPNVIVQNMPGAGGVTAANWVAAIAPRDGLLIATLVHIALLDRQIGVGPGGSLAKFDPNAFGWVGNVEQSVGTCGVSKASGVQTFDELMTRETVFGGSAVGGALSLGTFALRNLLGAKLKIAQGYKGSADLKLAFARGEIEGICGLPISTLRTNWRDVVDSGQFRPVIQLNHDPHPQLAGLPHLNDFARTEEEQQVFDLVFGSAVLGRVYFAPPGVPPERLAMLRAAFDATMTDAEFRAFADAGQLEVSPASGEAVAALIKRYTSVSDASAERARRAIKP
jgi:tripartite-type tricarboxylate transporter receptor subunit TctC